MEENTNEDGKSQVITLRKQDVWRYSTFVLGVLVIVLLFVAFGNNGGVTGNVVNAGDDSVKDSGSATAGNVGADDDAFLGPEDAKIVVIEFSDFQCPYCGAVVGTHGALISQLKSKDPTWEAAVPKLKELAKAGKIKFVFRDFPLNFHQNAQKAAEASECAGEQDKFWEYHDKLFENQERLDVNSLKTYASQLGLDSGKFNKCLDSGEMAEEVRKDLADGQKAGVRGTPAFFVNGELISGAQSFKAVEQRINALS
ncbi:MAG: thioredoxin domain-containing protein [archaeon]